MNEDIDVDALLDGTLDDLADLPEFKPYVAGVHQVLASFDIKEIKGHGKCPELSFKYVECIELEDSQEAEPEVGDEASTLYMLDNNIGQGKFKEIIAAFKIGLNLEGTNRQVMAQIKDVECVIASTVTTDKEDSTRKYLNVVQLEFV